MVRPCHSRQYCQPEVDFNLLLLTRWCIYLDKYCKLKEEVPPWLAETHQKAVGEAYDIAKRGEGNMPDESYGLTAMNVAGLTEGQLVVQRINGGDGKITT